MINTTMYAKEPELTFTYPLWTSFFGRTTTHAFDLIQKIEK